MRFSWLTQPQAHCRGPSAQRRALGWSGALAGGTDGTVQNLHPGGMATPNTLLLMTRVTYSF